MSVVSCVAPVHVNLIKIWGKRDALYNLPKNDSISVALDMDIMCGKATVVASEEFIKYQIIINGKEENFSNRSIRLFFNDVKDRAEAHLASKMYVFKIRGQNNIPKELQFDAKAAECAAIVTAVGKIYEVKGNISDAARLCHGPSCRNMYGGFVRWYMGVDPRGFDSIARPIIGAEHWSNMRILILNVKNTRTFMPQISGLWASEYFKFRVTHIVSQRTSELQEAIYNMDFQTFAELTMKESDEMQAVFLSSRPPIILMNDISHSVIEFVHLYNKASGKIKIAYTFETNPNPILFLLEEDIIEFFSVFHYFFPPPVEKTYQEYLKGIFIDNVLPISESLIKKMKFVKHLPGKIEYMIHTRPGGGPKIVSDV